MAAIALILLGLFTVVAGIVWLRAHPFVVLILSALIVGVLTPAELVYQDAIRAAERSDRDNPTEIAEAAAKETVGQRIAEGFGTTCRKIGILIAMASIIGTCLLESGAARRIVDAAQNAVGEKRTPLAFAASGFVLGIPVFFDTVFFLLIPLARALYARTGKHYVLYVLSVVVGATMAHSLVPPTPGPLLVASELGLDLNVVVVAGLIVGGIAAVVGFLFAVWLDRRITPVDISRLNELSNEEAGAETNVPDRSPTALWALLPIVLPVLLLAFGTFSSLPRFAEIDNVVVRGARTIGQFVGNKNIALTLSAVVAMGLLWWSRKGDREATSAAVQRALSAGGTVLLVTAAGGAFGHIIRQTNIAGEVVRWIPSEGTGVALLLIAFFITALVRVAQGSATVAMITAVSIVAPVVAAIELPFHAVYVFLAIGCGSKPLPWMNDSGFWVVGRMSGFTPGETLKTFSMLLTVMGLVGLVVTICGAVWFPLL